MGKWCSGKGRVKKMLYRLSAEEIVLIWSFRKLTRRRSSLEALNIFCVSKGRPGPPRVTFPSWKKGERIISVQVQNDFPTRKAWRQRL